MHGAATRLRGQELKLSHFALSTAKRYPSHLNTNKIWQCSLVAGVLATSSRVLVAHEYLAVSLSRDYYSSIGPLPSR